jgi:protease-4
MKKFIIITLTIVIFISLSATEKRFFGFLADEDGIHSPLVNPAAMAVENSSGVSLIYQSGKANVKNHIVLTNFENLSYVYENYEDLSIHRIYSSEKLFRNFYFGTGTKWINEKTDLEDLRFNFGFLYRPTDYTSFAYTSDNFNQKLINHNFGISLRPFPNTLKLTLSADMSLVKEDKDFKSQKPVIGFDSEIFKGVKIGGNYNMESETVGINFALNFNNIRIGSISNLDEDKKYASSYSYVNISAKNYSSLPFLNNANKIYDYKLAGSIVDINPIHKIGPFVLFDNSKTELDDVKNKLTILKNDKSIKGIVFQSGGFSSNFANMQELQEAFADFKSSGKKIIFYFESISNAEYILASSIADKIYLNPAGSVDLHGIGVKSPYFKNLLDKLDIDVYNFRSHPFKTAGNMFSEEHMTDSERESLDYILSGIYEDMVNMIKSGRGEKLQKKVKTLIDEGPYFESDTALKLGLVDGLIYQDQLKSIFKNEYKAKTTKLFPMKKMKYAWKNDKKDEIAIIYAKGNISSGHGVVGKSIGSKSLVKDIQKARKDKKIKGIILRVNSGGGSALASDIIAREIELCKHGKNAKPVVVSMGGVAASGGYFISCFADKIVAEPSTITGSIGVIGIIPNFSRLYHKIGVNWDFIQKGKHANLGTTTRPMTDEEKEIIRKSIEYTYHSFVSTVAKGRKMNYEDVNKNAQGRVWTGRQALERGLIDELGSIEIAKNEMKKILNTGNELKIVKPQKKQYNDFIKISMSGKLAYFINPSLALPSYLRESANDLEMINQISKDKILMINTNTIDLN